jgi:CheY-like chemotaxis protein
MIVEDEGLLCLMLEDYLNELGCEVVAIASRLPDALHKAQQVAMDVAVLDINLAGEMSYPVAELLRTRDIPFLFCTGYGMAGLPPALRDAPLLEKPYRMDQLDQALRQARGDRRRAMRL